MPGMPIHSNWDVFKNGGKYKIKGRRIVTYLN